MQQSKLQQFLDDLSNKEQSFFLLSIQSYCGLSRKELRKIIEVDPRNRDLKDLIDQRAFYRYSKYVYKTI